MRLKHSISVGPMKEDTDRVQQLKDWVNQDILSSETDIDLIQQQIKDLNMRVQKKGRDIQTDKARLKELEKLLTGDK